MTEPLLTVRDLAIRYGEKTVVEDVSLDIPQGRITALVGPSGCGKSSFLNCLNRMTDLIPGCQVRGEITFDGQNIHDPRTDVVTLRRRIGMIFQRPAPFPLSIRQNLYLPLREAGCSNKRELQAVGERVLREVGLWDEVADRLDKPALTLSGGQQQRLCLARALTLRPQLLLLDEPCSSLDPLSTELIEQLLKRMRGQYTILIVTHNLAQARRLADEVALFWVRDGVGKLIEHGPTQTMFESPRDPDTKAYFAGLRG
jgi:phosphate transport system ATP-binding protein